MNKQKTTPKRKAIGNKVRFEVFKRDSFTCQYCGQKAPDVLLEVDHIKPVIKGGTNDILNLVTSCKVCNSGKSKNELSDDSVIEKQRRQLEELEQRRQQLEMLMQWHIGLQDHEDFQVDKYIGYFNKVHSCNAILTDEGKKTAKKYIKKYGFQKVLEGINVLHSRYSHLEIEERFKKLGGVLTYLTASEDEKHALYIKGVCKNRFAYFDFTYGTKLITQSLCKYEYEFVLQIAKEARNWSQWRNQMEDLVSESEEEDLPF